jgi:hypothetical protein
MTENRRIEELREKTSQDGWDGVDADRVPSNLWEGVLRDYLKPLIAHTKQTPVIVATRGGGIVVRFSSHPKHCDVRFDPSGDICLTQIGGPTDIKRKDVSGISGSDLCLEVAAYLSATPRGSQ